ncbi:serotriflin-like [Petromyzon marinus]|uniref:serotriflin-like n=1 Tax=Petromyzon marinus TaxID=7757 RepID=UPI003F71696F
MKKTSITHDADRYRQTSPFLYKAMPGQTLSSRGCEDSFQIVFQSMQIKQSMGSAATVLLVLALAPVPGTEGAPASTVSDWKSLNTSQASVQKAIVDLHNQLRRSVSPAASNMLQMVWNKEAANNSAVWAKSCSFNHSPTANRKTSAFTCGENLFISSAPFTWDYAVRDWHSEVVSPGFEFGKGAKGPGMIGHYTQVVWHSSYQVGCAVNYCGDSAKYLYVCHYCPAGNLNTRLTRPYDNGPACNSCPKNCTNKLCSNACPFADSYANCAQMKSALGCGDTPYGRVVRAACPASCQCADKIY